MNLACRGRIPSHHRAPAALACLLVALLLSGCHHRAPAVYAPAPPSITRIPAPPESSGRPIFTEVGGATWYHSRTPDELTAAHRTLPYNTMVRITNLTTGQVATVRINDRGPFVRGRIIDLSAASAKAVGVWRPGLVTVKLEVFSAPAAIASGGRWCVQIGPFAEAKEPDRLRDRLVRDYPGANVVEYISPTGHWVRIRPPRDDKQQAIEIADTVNPENNKAYLVRLD